MLLFLLLLNKSTSTSFNLTTQAKPICISQYAIIDENLSLKYIISGSKEFNTRVILYTPSSSILYTSPPRTRECNRIFRATQEGLFKLCFYNKDSSPKKITFFFSKQNHSLNDINTKDHLSTFGRSFSKLGENLDSLSDNVNFYQVRERYYRDLSEKTSDFVLFGATCKILTLTLVFSLQVYTITKVLPVFTSKSVV